MQTPLVVGQAKSATQFIALALAQSIGSQVRQISYMPVGGQIIPPELWAIRGTDNVGRSHAPASRFNLGMIREAGFERFVLLVRDPRDALISWWHHLDRELIKSNGWALAQDVADGLRTASYYSLSRDEQIDQLIRLTYPAFVRWIADWMNAIDSGLVSCLIVRYEDFCRDQRSHVSKMLRYFGSDAAPLLPERGEQKISDVTNQRRGVSGSHKDELTDDQVARLDAVSPHGLFQRMGWQIGSPAIAESPAVAER